MLFSVTEGMINPSSTLGLIEQEILDSDICIRPSPVQTITHDINCPICALYYPGKYVEVSYHYLFISTNSTFIMFRKKISKMNLFHFKFL